MAASKRGQQSSSERSPDHAADPIIVTLSVAGASLTHMASKAGVSVSTVQRRLADPGVVAQISIERRRLLERLVGLLGSSTEVATRRLTELVSHDDPQVALKAIGVLLGHTFKAVSALETNDRMARIEEQLALLAENRDGAGFAV